MSDILLNAKMARDISFKGGPPLKDVLAKVSENAERGGTSCFTHILGGEVIQELTTLGFKVERKPSPQGIYEISWN